MQWRSVRMNGAFRKNSFTAVCHDICSWIWIVSRIGLVLKHLHITVDNFWRIFDILRVKSEEVDSSYFFLIALNDKKLKIKFTSVLNVNKYSKF
jgi:hypothetical protein